MDTVQPLLLASGLVVGGGLLGTLVSAGLQRRKLHRQVTRAEQGDKSRAGTLE